MRINPNPSVLDQLSPEQQDQLFSWLEIHSPSEVAEMVRRPPPEGFGITTYPTSLRRFSARRKLTNRKEELHLALEAVLTADSESSLDQATASAIRHLAFELSTQPQTDVRVFKAISRWVMKLRDQAHHAKMLAVEQERAALARDRLEFDRKKFQFNAARAALNHHLDLGKILADDTLDNEDKILAARDKLFGAPPPLNPNHNLTLNPNPSEP
jgi:hypothetical protein